MWYRYYNVSEDRHFFTDYESNKVYELEDLPEEQRKTCWAYKWGRIEENPQRFQ